MVPFKKVSDETVAILKEKSRKALIQVKEVNLAEERLKKKEENERLILKEEYRRKQAIMKEVK